MNRYLLPGAALMSVISGGASAAPTPIGTFTPVVSTANPAPTGSTGLGTFNPIGSPTGVGGIGGAVSFTAPFTGTLVMTVGPAEIGGVPFGLTGDRYQAFLDGTSLGFTSKVPLFGTSFSTGTFTAPISAGPNNFNINDQLLSYIGLPPPFGSDDPSVIVVPASFSPGSLMVTLAEELPSAVPEPSSLALFAAWLTGLALLWRRRRLG